MALGTPDGSCHAFPMWTDQRGSEVLPLAECVRLLALAAKRGQTGRLAVSTEQAPIIQPVNFTYHEHRIVVRLGSGHLAEVIPGTLVAFEVDHVDRDAREAWSVLVRGLATALQESDSDSQPTSDAGPAPLVPAPGDELFVVRLDVVTGRRFPLDRTVDSAGGGAADLARVTSATGRAN